MEPHRDIIFPLTCLQASSVLVQVLLNTATLEVAAERMEADGAPAHIHGMNLVRLRRLQSQANRHSPLLLDLQAKLYARFSQA